MNAVSRAVLVSCMCMSVAACGDLYRRNELFSSATKKPPSVTAAVAEPSVAETPASLDRDLDAERSVAETESRVRTASPTASPRRARLASAKATTREASRASLAADAAERPETAAPRPAAGSRPSLAARREAAPIVATATPTPGSAVARGSDAAGAGGVKPTPGDQILAGLLRVWNKVAMAELSSKVLFGVWPEDIDGRKPAGNELAKRGEVTVQ